MGDALALCLTRLCSINRMLFSIVNISTICAILVLRNDRKSKHTSNFLKINSAWRRLSLRLVSLLNIDKSVSHKIWSHHYYSFTILCFFSITGFTNPNDWIFFTYCHAFQQHLHLAKHFHQFPFLTDDCRYIPHMVAESIFGRYSWCVGD